MTAIQALMLLLAFWFGGFVSKSYSLFTILYRQGFWKSLGRVDGLTIAWSVVRLLGDCAVWFLEP
jgi:hypothetical protein